MEKRITVFTPTYNRAYILPALYQSLLRQTNQDFKWLIVDDGSTDDTRRLIEAWILEGNIEIYYFYQQNGGKQRAHNKGVEKCDTELFVCVDSDDYLTDDAIESLYDKWDNITNQSSVCGIVALRGYNETQPVGTFFQENIEFSRLRDLYKVYQFKGDTLLMYRRDILKEFPFYVYENEMFIGESYVYNQIDNKYQLAILNKILYICKYLPDGYTKNLKKTIKNNPQGYALLKKQEILYSKGVKDKYIATVKYLSGCILANKKDIIVESPNKFLALCGFIPAMLYVKFNFR